MTLAFFSCSSPESDHLCWIWFPSHPIDWLSVQCHHLSLGWSDVYWPYQLNKSEDEFTRERKEMSPLIQWFIPHNLIILIKNFVLHIFPIILVTLQDFHEICVHKFLALLMRLLCLSSLPPRKWSLPRQWHLKRLKLCMSTTVMIRFSLPNRNTTPLRVLWPTTKQNKLLLL